MTSTPQRLDLIYEIHWEGTWHVGSGQGTAQADRLIRRRGGLHGPPFVPGAQIKGVLRHRAERLAASLGCTVVSPHAFAGEQEQALVRHFQPLNRSSLIVDRLFGSRYQGECLFVDDALPKQRTKDKGQGTKEGECLFVDDALPACATDASPGAATRLVTRTAIDRVTGTVKERHLFVTELAEGKDVPLRGAIRARHGAGVLRAEGDGFPLEYALLVRALLDVDALGGDKSAGSGRCHIVLGERGLTWNGRPMAVEEALAWFREDDWSEWLELLDEEGGQS